MYVIHVITFSINFILNGYYLLPVYPCLPLGRSNYLIILIHCFGSISNLIEMDLDFYIFNCLANNMIFSLKKIFYLTSEKVKNMHYFEIKKFFFILEESLLNTWNLVKSAQVVILINFY